VTTIVEMPIRLNSTIKKVIDRQEEFKRKISSSQIITYTLEYFANCFNDEPSLLKGINIRLYNLQLDQRPEINQYMITWEDFPKKDDETWNEFCLKVNQELTIFLDNLKQQSNAIEGT